MKRIYFESDHEEHLTVGNLNAAANDFLLEAFKRGAPHDAPVSIEPRTDLTGSHLLANTPNRFTFKTWWEEA